MRTFISLLRGINIGGHHLIPMPALRTLYESLGMTDVTTYIQSGNVVFRTDRIDRSSLELLLEEEIARALGFPVAVIVRTPLQLSAIIRACPYAGRAGIDTKRLAVAFLKSKPSAMRIRALRALTAKGLDEYTITGRALYMHCPQGFAKTMLTNAFLEKHLLVKVTARNWKTTVTLLEMCRTLSS